MMQGDLLTGKYETIGWEVKDILYVLIKNKATGTSEKFILECKTVPVDWNGPDRSDKLPWE